MRILHTVHAYPPSSGGSEEVVHRLSRGLAERGHQVEVATSSHPDRGAEVDGIPVEGFDVPTGAWAYRRWVLEGLKQDRWDVVMTYHSKVWSHLALWPFPAELAERWVYCPTEFTDVDSWHPRHLVYYRTVEPTSLRRAARAVVLTRGDEARAGEIAGEGLDESLERIPNGVDADWWANGQADGIRQTLGLPSEAPLVVYAGGLWEHKDVETLVEAVARLDEVHLAIAGPDRGRREAILDRIRQQGVVDRVHLLGYVDREELRALYHSADVFASASRNEGFGLVYLEAMSCGLPVVARRVGVIPELEATDALVRVAEDAEGFADHIAELVDVEAEVNREIAGDYDWEHIVDRFEALYEEVAREAGP